MTPYENAVRAFRIKYCLEAVLLAHGNVCQAARETGIHRNTLTRLLVAGGYAPKQVRHDCRLRKVVVHADQSGSVEWQKAGAR